MYLKKTRFLLSLGFLLFVPGSQSYAMDNPNNDLENDWENTFQIDRDIISNIFPEKISFEILEEIKNKGSAYITTNDGVQFNLFSHNINAISSVLPGFFQIATARYNFPIKTGEVKVEDSYQLEYTYNSLYPGVKSVKLFLSTDQAPILQFTDDLTQSTIAQYKEDNISYSSEIYTARAISNIFKASWSPNRLAPSWLNGDLDTKVRKLGLWMPSRATYGIYTLLSIYKTAILAGRRVVVSNTANDAIQDPTGPLANQAGGLALKTVFDAITQDASLDSDLSVYVPLAQTKGRNHFVHIKAERTNGYWTFSHIDSMGLISSCYYSLGPIANLLINTYGGIFKALYLGHQGLRNMSDCGRFVQSYIVHDLHGHDIKNLSLTVLQEYFS